MNKNKFISLAAVSVALVATVGMDYLIVPEEARNLWILFSIASAALIRLYMFYEGTALAEFNEDHAKLAYRFSIGLSVFFGGYIIAIWVKYPETPTYYFILLGLLTFSVLAAEWVFSKRVSYQISPAVAALEIRLTQLAGKQEQAKRILFQVWKGWRAAQKQIASLESEANGRLIQIENLEQEISGLHPLAQLAQKFKGHLLLAGGQRYAMCMDCLQDVLVHNRAHEANCPTCRQLVWQKEMEEVS